VITVTFSKPDSIKFSFNTIAIDLPEFEEFAEALIGQLEVEISEEKGRRQFYTQI